MQEATFQPGLQCSLHQPTARKSIEQRISPSIHEVKNLEQVLAQADSAVYGDLLRQCANERALSEGKLIHEHIQRSRYSRQTYLGNLLVQMYAKCGHLGDACAVFDRIHPKNRYSWNIMIAAYAQNGHTKEALELFREIGARDGSAGKVAFVNVLGACSSPEALADGKELHAQIIENGFETDAIVATALLSMYGKCGSIDDARWVFDRMQERTVIPWNAMIAAYAQTGHCAEAMKLFRQMDLESVQPNHISYVTVVDACAGIGDLAEGRAIHARMIATGFDSFDIATGNALINMYGKCRSPDEARNVFDGMQSRNVISWTAMVSAYAESEQHAADALRLFHEMDLEGAKPNETTFIRIICSCSSLGALAEGKAIHERVVAGGFNSNVFLATGILNMYSKWGHLDDARRAFGEIQEKDSIAWNSIIAALESHGHAKQALEFHKKMDLEGMKPTEGTFASVLSAISSSGALAEGKAIHGRIVSSGFEFLDSSVLGNALVHMFGKCGALQDAQQVFDSMRRRNIKCWTALIEAYAQQGHGNEALRWFQAMHLEGIQPDKVAFVGLLFACSHAGLLDHAVYYFASMREDHGIEPIQEHYECMVDLLGRAGQLDKAKELIQTMPFHPNGLAWMTLLGACKMHANELHGGDAAEKIFDLEPQNASSYVTLSNIYSKR